MKTTFKPENVIEILDENTASCAKVYCVLTKELSKKRKPTESVPSLKEIAQQYKLQVRSIKKALSYLISKDFISPEDFPSNWELESKSEITKDVQKVINIVTEAAVNSEEVNSVDGVAIAKVKTVTDIKMMKKIYCLISYILSNSYLDEKIVAKLDKDWFRKPFDKTRYKEQLKFNKEWKRKQQELQQEKVSVQDKRTDSNVIEVDAERVETPIPEATQKRFTCKQDRIFQQKKQNLNRRYTAY
jgi:DNA-binding transcriptional regulator YhcF (GntR family)